MVDFSYTIRKVVQPDQAEIEKMVAVLLTAFSSDTQIPVGFGPHSEKLEEPLNRAHVVAGSLAGEIYVAEDTATKNIIGVCIWFGPGRDLYDSEDQRTLAMQPFSQMLPPELKGWMGEISKKVEKFKAESWGEGTTVTQWYLQRIGVLPEYQKRGVGAALIKEVLGKTDGLSAALTCIYKPNAEYYGHLGFKVKGHQEFDAPYGKFEVWAMLWEPDTAAV